MTFTMPTLLPHQEIVKDFIVQQPKCGIFLTMGGGKSLCTLSALAEIRPAGHILVVAPINIARSTWVYEITKWGFPLTAKSLIVNDNDKKLSKAKRLQRYADIWTDPPTMYFINVDLIDDLVANMPTQKVDGKNVIMWPFQTVIIDESQTLKNPQSNRFKALKKVAPATVRFIELSGTPTPQGLKDLWSQMYLLDGGVALGAPFSTFRETFFRATAFHMGRPTKWEPLPGAEAEIHRRVKSRVMSALNTSIPMPDVSIDQVPIVLDKGTLEAYRDFTKTLVLDLASPDPQNPGLMTITADNKAILANKQVQFASGTMYTDEFHNFAVIHDEKLKMADYLIRNNGGSPVIIAYKFQSDKTQLLEHLSAAGHDVQAFDGSRAMLAKWNAGHIPVLLLQPASAGHGLNFQDGGHTLIWFTLPDSLEQYLQTNARLARMGQKHPVQIWELITRGTRDERLPTMLERKAVVQQSLLDAVLITVGNLGPIALPTGPALEWDDLGDDVLEILGDLDLSPV